MRQILCIKFVLILSCQLLLAQNPFSDLVDQSIAVCDIDAVLNAPQAIQLPDSSSFTNHEIEDLDMMLSPLLEGCGTFSFRINNPFIFRFYGDEPTGRLNININNCPDGVQIALLKDYSNPESIYCNAEKNLGNNIEIPISELNANEEYFLLIDGFGGNACNISFNNLEGFNNYPELDESTIELIPEEIVTGCAGGTINFNVEKFYGLNIKSDWIIKDNNQNILVEGQSQNAKWEVILDPGSYIAEFILKSPCDETNKQSFDFEIAVPKVEILDIFTYCNLDFPNIDHPDPRIQNPVPEPINDTINYIIKSQGCDELLKIPIVAKGQKEIESIELVFCEEGPYFLGNGFEITREYNNEFVNIGENGAFCDSIIQLTANILHVKAKILQESCRLFRFNYDQFPNINQLDEISYSWLNGDTEVLQGEGMPTEVEINEPGEISINISLTKGDVVCDFDTSINSVKPQTNLTCEGYHKYIELEWGNSENINTIDIYRDGELLQNTSELNYQDTSVQDNQVYIYSIQLKQDDGCVLMSDSVKCQTYICPASEDVFFSIASKDEVLCPSMVLEDYKFKGNALGPLDDAAIYWTGIPGITFDGKIDLDSLSIGKYEAYVVYENKYCQYKSESVKFELIDNLDASFNIPEETCQGEPVKINYVGTNSNNIIFDIKATGEYTLTGESLTDLEIHWNSPGIYTVQLTVLTVDCISEEVIRTIIVKQQDKVTSIRSSSNRQSILFDWDPIECAESYAIYLNNEKILVQNELNYTYLPNKFSEIQTIDFQVGIEESSCQCPGLSTVIRESLDNRPNVRINIEDPGIICMNSTSSTIQIDYSIRGSEDDGIVIWRGSGINNGGVFNPQIAGLGTHKLTVIYRESDQYFVSDSIFITVEQSPELLYQVTAPNCGNEYGNLTTKKLDDIDIFINNTMIINEAVEIDPGFHTIEFVSSNGCAVSENFSIDFAPNITSEIVGPSQVIEQERHNFYVITRGDTTTIDSIVWYDNRRKNPLCQNCDKILVYQVIESFELCANIYFNSGCVQTECKTVIVTESNSVVFPNVFSPSQQEPNNYFKPLSKAEGVALESMQIFNRNGFKVFEISNVLLNDLSFKGWDGRFLNNYVESGVYIYYVDYITILGDHKSKTGSVNFIK